MRSISLYRPGWSNGEPARSPSILAALAAVVLAARAAAIPLAVGFVLAFFVAPVDPISARASMLDETIAAGTVSASPAADQLPQQTPGQLIERFHAELLIVMQNSGDWDYRARRDRLAPSVVEMFDSGSMTRIASGRYWKTFEDDQKSALTAAFRAFTLANYAARFNGYSGQVFETTGETRRDDRHSFVRTRLIVSDGEAIRIDYLMRLTGRKWRIIDVFVEGRFSELAVRRSEFAPVLRDRGFPGLIEVLRNKVSELEAENGAG